MKFVFLFILLGFRLHLQLLHFLVHLLRDLVEFQQRNDLLLELLELGVHRPQTLLILPDYEVFRVDFVHHALDSFSDQRPDFIHLQKFVLVEEEFLAAILSRH